MPPQRSSSSITPPSPPDGPTTNEQPTNEPTTKLETQIHRRRDVLWRDFLFVIAVGIALRIVSYVETQGSERGLGGQSPTEIVDAGFLLTQPLFEILQRNPFVNDVLAFVNSLVLIVPTLYAAWVTFWVGDYTLAFRLIATQLFRSFCGWFTYLPPDPTFLMSIYDFPEIVQCLFEDCAPQQEGVLPFVSFFSGHVACTVIIANHMYMRNRRRAAMTLHVFNIFQILRLLATRGHYSIDIIIGWVVAVYVSNPADKLGLYYSRGVLWRELVPRSKIEAFETVAGLHCHQNYTVPFPPTTDSDCDRVMRNQLSSSSTMLRSYQQHLINDPDAFLYQSPTTAKILSEFVHRNLSDLRNEVLETLSKIQISPSPSLDSIYFLRQNDLIQLLTWAQLKVDELRKEAHFLGILRSETMSKREILGYMLERMKLFQQWQQQQESCSELNDSSTQENFQKDEDTFHDTFCDHNES